MTTEHLNRAATRVWRDTYRARKPVGKVDKIAALADLASQYAKDYEREEAVELLFRSMLPPIKKKARDQVEFCARALSTDKKELRRHCKTLHSRDGELWGCSGIAVRAATLHTYGWSRGCTPKTMDGRAHYSKDGVLIPDYKGIVPNYPEIMEGYSRTEHTERDELSASVLADGTLLVGVHGCRVLWVELEQALRDLEVSHVFEVANDAGLLITSNNKEAMCFLTKVKED